MSLSSLALGLLAAITMSVARAQGEAFIRVNQVGYTPGESKTAFLMSSQRERGATFSVQDDRGDIVFSGAVPERSTKWNARYAYIYALNLTAVSKPGVYRIIVSGPSSATSPIFRIDSSAVLYAPLINNAAHFYAAQSDMHNSDGAATVYDTPNHDGDHLKGSLKAVGGPIDVSGGWYDAGDYLEFVETTSYADAALLLASRDFPHSPIEPAAHEGLLWLLKMWDTKSRTLYYQIGIGDGNSQIRGDHDLWRLPAADNSMNVSLGDADYFLKYRPVFRAGPAGAQISPNLAGRLAAAFALGYQVYHHSQHALAEKCLVAARIVFAAAKTRDVGRLITAVPFSYYPETEWRDDMEWGAVELYNATGEAMFLRAAAHWAKAYLNSSDGGDTPNLYDVGAIAHYESALALSRSRNISGNFEITTSDLIGALKAQLANANQAAAKEPFGFGIPKNSGDVTPHAIGLAVEAELYHNITGDSFYDPLMQSQIAWVLGRNAWGMCFIVGAGAIFPQHLHHQIANLTGTPLIGAVVDGPAEDRQVAALIHDIPEGASLPADVSDPYEAFTGHGLRLTDSVGNWAGMEPALDYTALTPLLFLSIEHQ